MSVVGLKRTIRRGLGAMAPAVWRFRPKPSLLILTYHRVLPKDHPDRLIEQPGMYVSPETLAMHLRVLKNILRLWTSVTGSPDATTGQSLPNRACAITFDDGWRDNYDYGFPVLKREQAPATIFLVADFVGSNYEFWPNRLARLLSGFGSSPASLSPRMTDLLMPSCLGTGRFTNATTIASVDAVISAYKAAASDDEIVRILDDLESRMDLGIRDRSLLDLAEIQEMGESGFIRFGSHSRRHTRLVDGLDRRVLEEEVRGSRDNLQALIGRPIDLFCYPNGDCSTAALAAVRSTYVAGVTTRKGWNPVGSDRHLLRRVSMHDDVTADEYSFMARIAGMA